MNTNNLSQFEEEILVYLKDIEEKLTEKIDIKNSEINIHLNSFESKINDLFQNYESIKESIINYNIYKNKMIELESFKNKADDILISHELRLKNNITDIDFLKDKYETIIKENLLVPGYIGSSCKYKNLSNYLTYNIIELNKIKTDKDDRKKDIKEIKIKLDNLMKSMINLNDGSVERCKDYTNSIQKDIVNYIENKLKEYEEKYFDIKTEIYKYHSSNEQKFNDINTKLLEIKKEFNNILKQKIEQIKNAYDTLKDKIEINTKNIENNSQFNKNINDNIKEINLNLKDFTNFKNSYLLPKNNPSSQGNPSSQLQQGIGNYTRNNDKKSTKKMFERMSDINKPLTSENSKSNKKYMEKNINNENKINIKNSLKSQNFKNKIQEKQLKDKNYIRNTIKNDFENENDNENEKEINSDIDNHKYKNIYSNNNSFEKTKMNTINNNKYRFYSNSNLNIYKNDLNYKNRTTLNDFNKYFKKETINAKSITQLK